MKSIAVIGLGAVVRNIHMPAYAQLRDRVRVVAGCDADLSAREHARRSWGLAVFDDPREMIESTRPDIVAVCTPPWMHLDHVLAALELGCHVFCEKPVADSLADADRMIQASEARGKLVVVNNQFPYMRIHAAAKRQIGSGEFGELLYLHAWHTMRTTDHTEAGWRGKLQRRLCFEFGIHVLDLVRYFFDAEPSRILAHMPNPEGRAKCDVVNAINLEFADGRGASIVLDRLSRGPERYLDMRLDGERASIHTSIGGRLKFEAGLHTRERRPYLAFTFAKGGRALLEDGNRSRLLAREGLNPFGDATAAHFRSFLDAIEEPDLQNAECPRGRIQENRDALALVMAAYDSAERGQWIEMGRYATKETSAGVKAR